MFRYLMAFVSIFFVQSVLAAAPNPSVYPYQAKLNTGPVQKKQVIQGTLSEDILKHITPNFGNLQVLDDLNAQVPFVLFDEPAAQTRTLNRVEVSSAHEKTPAENLLDDNRLTHFGFSQSVNTDNPATITIDFGRKVRLHRLELWPTNTADISGMAFRHGLAKDNLKTLRRQTAFNPIIDSEFPELKWLEISLWGKNVLLEDLNTFERAGAKVYFTANPERRYRLLFGDNTIDNKRYQQRVSEAERFDQSFGFTAPSFNPLAANDFDNDGLDNKEDNCPLLSNKTQNDSDADGIGNVCDNARDVKNYAQSDVDNDGIGDLIDNCKLAKNTSQKDKDGDGFGDKCDSAYVKESWFAASVNTPQSATGSLSSGFVGLILAALAILGLGIFVGKKNK